MMAQGALATPSFSVNGTGSALSTALTAEELREILEYDRIVQFRDAVLAGTHPRVKIPPHLVGKPVPPPINLLPNNLQVSNTQSHAVLRPTRSPPSTRSDASKNSQDSSGFTSMFSGHAKAEINPILLEKSEDLIRAEIQLQRQRLERDLREQIEQQRVAARAALQTSEALPGFDLSEVLSKALAIAQPSANTGAVASGDGRSSASDSFDERTFYSSQHDTPMSSSSRGHQGPTESQSHIVVSPQRSALPSQVQGNARDKDVTMSKTSYDAIGNAVQSMITDAQGSQLANSAPSEMSRLQSNGSPRVNGRAGAYSNSAVVLQDYNANDHYSDQPHTGYPIAQTASRVASSIHGQPLPSPLVRAHNLSPYAPQPSRVSPLITARDVPALLESQNVGAQPAQVTALRNVASGLSSTDSSPRADKVTKKKKKEKNKSKGKDREKKRKAKENVLASPDSPYIKPEPQSPEPFSATSLPRPQKRPRRSGQFSAGLTYDEPEIVENQPQRREPHSVIRAYSRNENRYENQRAEPGRAYHGHEASYRVTGSDQLDDAASRVYVTLPPSHSRSSRAVSRAVVDRRVVDEPLYYRDQVARASVRPDTFRERSRSPIYRDSRPIIMAPPRRPMRLVVDEYGNEHLEPIPVVAAPVGYRREQMSRASIRPEIERLHSGSPVLRDAVPSMMAPPKRRMRVVIDEFGNEYLEPIPTVVPTRRYEESDLPYERAQSRVVSNRAPVDVYEEGGNIYRQTSPRLVRRVVTQPEYISRDVDPRVYRQREYSVRPSAGSEQFVEIRAPERRTVSYHDDPMREVIRQPTIRPEGVRYEVPREYSQRVQSVRPEDPSLRTYTSSVRPEARRELPQQSIREYSVRPEAPSRVYAGSVRPEGGREVAAQQQREYSVRPAEQTHRRVYTPVQGESYYEDVAPRRAGELAYVERPSAREGSVMVYADDVRDVRRNVYR